MDQQNHRRPLTVVLRAIVIGCTFVGACASTSVLGEDLPKPSSAPHPISPHFFGVNIENSYMSTPVLSWTDPALERTIKKVGIQAIRFPGGDVGNDWDWQQGTVYPIGKASRTQDTLTALLDLTRATGTYPIYNLNVMTLDNAIVHRSNLTPAITSQLRMLDTARGMKLPIGDLELGNEFFWSSPDHDQAFPSAGDYATAMGGWTTRLKQAYPHARIASVGAIPSSGDARTQHWNDAVIGKIHDVEAVTLHRYDSILDGGVWDGTSPEAALSHVFTDWDKIQSDDVRPIEKAKLRTWVTEFGGLKDCTSHARLTGTWLEGLYQSQMAIQFLSTPAIEQIDLYNIAGSTSSLMFQNTSSYWNACQNKSMTFHAAAGELTATGQAYALIGDALKQAKAAYAVTFPKAPVVHPKSAASYPAITGIALTGETNQWLLLNLSPRPLTLTYPGMGQGTMESLRAPSLTTLVTSEHALTHETHAFDGRHFVLLPFSVNRLVVKASFH